MLNKVKKTNKQKNNSDYIREYFSSNSLNDSPQKVVNYLRNKGVFVTIHHVGMVKLSLRGYRILKRKGNASGKCGRNKKSDFVKSLEMAKNLFLSTNENLDSAKAKLKIVHKILEKAK